VLPVARSTAAVCISQAARSAASGAGKLAHHAVTEPLYRRRRCVRRLSCPGSQKPVDEASAFGPEAIRRSRCCRRLAKSTARRGFCSHALAFLRRRSYVRFAAVARGRPAYRCRAPRRDRRPEFSRGDSRRGEQALGALVAAQPQQLRVKASRHSDRVAAPRAEIRRRRAAPLGESRAHAAIDVGARMAYRRAPPGSRRLDPRRGSRRRGSPHAFGGVFAHVTSAAFFPSCAASSSAPGLVTATTRSSSDFRWRARLTAMDTRAAESVAACRNRSASQIPRRARSPTMFFKSSS